MKSVFEILCEAVESDEPKQFKKVQREEYDLACPHCNEIMGEKDFSFGYDEENGWTHKCKDGKTRKILPTDEQKKQAEWFDKHSSWSKK
jgi:hypothetical protein